MKIGIDIGGSHIAIGVINNNGIIVEKVEKRLTSTEKINLQKSIEDYIIDNVNKFKSNYNVTGLGIALPGRSKNGIIISSGNLGIKDYNIVDKLQAKIGLPINIKNDAKAAAIAEKKYGILKDYERSIFLTLGTGIGGAVFEGDKLLKAPERPAYEFGHMVIQKNGVQCKCGRRGCFERYASMKAFKDNLRNALSLDKKTTGEELLQIIIDNNQKSSNYKLIEDVITEYIDNLSIGINNLVRIFEPEVVGIGGSFVHFDNILLDRLKNKTKEELGREVKIETAILGNDAGMIGSICKE